MNYVNDRGFTNLISAFSTFIECNALVIYTYRMFSIPYMSALELVTIITPRKKTHILLM